MDLNRDKSIPYEVSVIVTDGLDQFVFGKDNSFFDLKVTKSTLLIKCHERISACLNLENNKYTYYYYRKDDTNHAHLDMNKTMEELNITEGSTIILNTTTNSCNNALIDLSNDSKSVTGILPIHIVCVSRLGAAGDGIVRKMKIITSPYANAIGMMKEIENHLQAYNLKFKFGKTVIKEDKSFIEQGIENGCEITVTGRSNFLTHT